MAIRNVTQTGSLIPFSYNRYFASQITGYADNTAPNTKPIAWGTAVRLNGNKKAQNLTDLCYEEIAITHDTKGDFGLGSP